MVRNNHGEGKNSWERENLPSPPSVSPLITWNQEGEKSPKVACCCREGRKKKGRRRRCGPKRMEQMLHTGVGSWEEKNSYQYSLPGEV
jgi:hypothetical protein